MGGPLEVTISGSTLSAPGQGQGSHLHARGHACLYHHGAVSLGRQAFPEVLVAVGSVTSLPQFVLGVYDVQP